MGRTGEDEMVCGCARDSFRGTELEEGAEGK